METRLAAPHPTDAATYSVIAGVILTLVGAVAVVLSAFSSLLTVVGVGVLLIVGGLALLLDAIRSHDPRRGLWTVLSILPVLLGALFVFSPGLGIRVVTPVLLALFFLDGALLVISAWRDRMWWWGLRLAAGLLELGLGVVLAARGFHLTLAGELVGLLFASHGLALVFGAVRLQRALEPFRRAAHH